LISIAIANQKGGVGKSTTAACESAALALRGKKVLLVDGDSRKTATRIMVRPSEIKSSLADVLLPANGSPAKLEDVVIRTQVENLDLVPATIQLANFDREGYSALLRMKDFLDQAKRRYDFAIIDTPPTLGMLVSATMAAVNYVIVAVQAEPEAFDGIGDLLQLIKVAKTSNRRLEILGALCTMYDGRTSVSPQVYDGLKKQFPGRTFKTVIDRQVRLSECPAVHKPIQLHAPNTRGAQQYGELADEILAILAGE
jgi:chromosome partitioning protein